MKVSEVQKMYHFNAAETTDRCVAWIRDFFDKNGKDCNAVIGVSGGKDSSVVAALCVAALGKDRVIGVLMPNGEQGDIDIARKLVKFLGIKSFEINIEDAVRGVLNNLSGNGFEVSKQTITNLPPRIRMATLYAVSQSMNGRVANTCNLSEDWVGYSTRYGDAAGDFSPLARLTVTEVKEIGRVLGLSGEFVDKTPADGLCGKTDEENLGFSYETLDRYIREEIEPEEEIKNKIDELHKKNQFKLELMPCFEIEVKE
ncbi:MAG: NAD(+) synthase [Lachnospiraceae bacterium]